jgi:tRNA (guanine10-N2)-methyltransferase
LKKRSYLGTTSFDAELSLVSANMARLKQGALMFDPFAGTGSFLVAAAAFGAVTLGGDIDIRVLKGSTRYSSKFLNSSLSSLIL